MARILTIPATGNLRPGTRKRTLSRSGLSAGPVSLQLVFIIVCTLVGLFYLVQSNQVSTEHLKIKQLEAQKAEVAAQNDRLSIEAARLQSVQQIKKSAEEQKLAQTQKAQAYERTGADQAVTATANSSSTVGQ